MKNLTITHSERIIKIPAVTKTYSVELQSQVEKYMADRHNFLCEGHHPLADLSRDSYINYLVHFFELPKDEVALDFDYLGQSITDRKQQEELDKRYSKCFSIENPENVVKELYLLRKEYLANRPTKGWDTKKMELHRDAYHIKAIEALGLELFDMRETRLLTGQAYFIDDETYVFTTWLFPNSEYAQKNTGFEITALKEIKDSYQRDYRFTLVAKDGKLYRMNNKTFLQE